MKHLWLYSSELKFSIRLPVSLRCRLLNLSLSTMEEKEWVVGTHQRSYREKQRWAGRWA
jgi:hypothetical protein